uniref:DUF725 domain-containing protein n=1 Tax=Panagrellus redivivus TaxID=6233 RepID=A0A7E4VC86_PANRE
MTLKKYVVINGFVTPPSITTNMAFNLDSAICLAIMALLAIASTSFAAISKPKPFIYNSAPPELALAAMQIGQNERIAYIDDLKKVKTEEESAELYTHHLGVCSTVASEESMALWLHLGDGGESASSRQPDIFDAMGVDSVSARLMRLPTAMQSEMIHQACLKHELQFQCAYGFLQDYDRIAENIEAMSAVDGNMKMMFETECKHPEESPSIYACLGENAAKWEQECGVAITAYNETRSEVNTKMGTIYFEIAASIKSAVEKATSRAELETVVADGTAVMTQTLSTLARLEGYKCRSYYQMERCLFKAVSNTCGADALSAISTILRVGYLRRERGDDLHNEFYENQVPLHRACAKVFSS